MTTPANHCRARRSTLLLRAVATSILWQVLLGCGVWAVRAADPGVQAPADRLIFETDIEPILTVRGCNSGGCHGKSGGQNGFALSLFAFDPAFDHASIVSAARGRRLAPAAPLESLLIQKGTGTVPHGGGKKLDPAGEDVRTLVRWIEQGTPKAGPDDPQLERISLSPAPRPLAPGESLELKVTAHYSDGATRDVTATSAWHAGEPAVLDAADARVRAGAFAGEGTIMARYVGTIATWSTGIVPPGSIDAAAVAALPRPTPLDEPVWRKLTTMNILPSEQAAESTLLRRASLDLIGRLPTPDEARAYLADPDPAKREKLVAALLDRSEYADFQANKWADLLRPNPYRVGIKATLSLDTFLRDVFRENLSYDDLVRRLLTATGSTWRDGATTVFRDRRSPDEIVTLVSQLFLGVRLECAKCHQHPFEVYGQSDFYSLAAFFGRVAYRGTGLSPPISGGEEIVTVGESGEVRHPLSGALLAPKPLFGTALEIPAGEDPRAALVDWLTAHDNPFFHRAAVNRIWGDLFGIGIVDPVDDFRATNPPTNPALLEALVAEFRAGGSDQKKLLATILRSAVWNRSSLPNATNAGDFRNFSRHYRQRLRAEVLADAIDDVTGVPTSYAGLPEESRAVQLWTHRTPATFLDVFGRPDPNQDPPCQRDPDATVVQALHLMNSTAIEGKIAADSSRAATLAASELPPDRIVEELYLACYTRFPTSSEREPLVALFAREGRSRRQVTEDILWSLINSPEFVFKD